MLSILFSLVAWRLVDNYIVKIDLRTYIIIETGILLINGIRNFVFEDLPLPQEPKQDPNREP